MQIFFSEAEENDSELFHSPVDNKAYYFSLEVTPEVLILKDTCGREVPLSHEDISSLQQALIIADHVVAPLRYAVTAINTLVSDKVYLV